MSLPAPPLLVITDRRLASRPLEDVVAATLDGGARWISLREKDLSSADRIALLTRLVVRSQPYGACIMVHEDVDAARAAGAAGVHLPRDGDVAATRARLGPAARIGLSAHSRTAVGAATGADYVTLSPIFLTESKPGYGPAVGLAALAEIAHVAATPIVALGGVTAVNAADCIAAGAAAIAVMGPIMRADDPAAITRALIAALSG